MSVPTFPPLPPLPDRAVVLMVGIPGSGKSTYVAAHECPALSTDVLRQLLFGDAGEQRKPDLVFGLLRQILSVRLQSGVPLTFLDATNLNSAARKPLLRIAGEAGYPVVAILMDVALEQCIKRNQERGRKVDPEVVRRMAKRLREPTAAEGVEHLYRASERGLEWVY